MEATYALLIVFAIFLLLRSFLKSRRCLTMIGKIPGPRPFPFVGNNLMFLVPREELLPVFRQLRDEYGDIFRTWHSGRPVVHLFSPEHVEAILGANKHLRKGAAYRFIRPWLGAGLITSDGRQWFTHRKLITPTFHFKILEGFVDVFNECSQVLIRKIEEECQRSTYFDIFPFITRCTLDIICETAMGTKINGQENKDSPFLTATLGISELIVKRQFTPWLQSSKIFYRTSYGKEFKKHLSVLHGFAESVISERKMMRQGKIPNLDEELDGCGVRNRKAFLDLLLDASENQSVSLTDQELRNEVDTFMFAGHDTTTAAITWAIFLLGNHPEIQAEVRAELKTIFQDEDRPATLRDLNEMKLLERVIKEALRLYPSVTMISRILDDDVDLGKYTVPAGTDLAIHVFNMHRNPRLYPNPNKFDPDRFLPHAAIQRQPFAYIPFSAGQRNCIGQKFAIHEEKVVLSTILRKFIVTSLHTPDQVPPVHELVGRPKSGAFMKFTAVK